MKFFGVVISGFILLGAIQCGEEQGNKLGSQQLSGREIQLAADLKDVTRTYLVEKFGETGFGGKAFCAYKVLAIEEKSDDINEYVYTVCQEFYDKSGTLKKGTGSGLPVALVLRKEGDAYKVLAHKVPGDGNRYSRDVEQIFPKRVHEEIFSAGSDYTSWKDEVEREAEKYYGNRKFSGRKSLQLKTGRREGRYAEI